jgi:hypothetical protein
MIPEYYIRQWREHGLSPGRGSDAARVGMPTQMRVGDSHYLQVSPKTLRLAEPQP